MFRAFVCIIHSCHGMLDSFIDSFILDMSCELSVVLGQEDMLHAWYVTYIIYCAWFHLFCFVLTLDLSGSKCVSFCFCSCLLLCVFFLLLLRVGKCFFLFWVESCIPLLLYFTTPVGDHNEWMDPVFAYELRSTIAKCLSSYEHTVLRFILVRPICKS